jgi:hypothetical protein
MENGLATESLPGKPQLLLEIFKETNQHIRSTESKSLALMGMYLAFFTSFVTNHSAWSREAENVSGDVHYLALALSVIVFVLQIFYRSWKVHYMRRCRVMVRGVFDIGEANEPSAFEKASIPEWMLTGERTISVDNFLLVATVIATTAVGISYLQMKGTFQVGALAVLSELILLTVQSLFKWPGPAAFRSDPK